jgi:methyl-accepting chemotaxis protein
MNASKSLKIKLITKLLPMVVLGIAFITFIAYNYTSRFIKEEYSQQVLKTIIESSTNINTWLKGRLLEVESIASTPAAKNINRDFASTDKMNIDRFLYLTKKYPEEFADIYSANSNYEYHTVKNNDGVISLFKGSLKGRDYYESIMSGGPAQITPPLISRTTGLPTVFMVAPILDSSGKPQGLIGAGILLNYVQNVVTRLKLGKTGYGVCLAKNGQYIEYPDKTKILKESILESPDENLKNLGKEILSSESGIHKYKFNGVKKIAFSSRVEINGWHIVIVVDESEFFSPVTSMLLRIAVISFFIALITGVLIIYLSTKILAPINDIAEFADRLSAGDLTARIHERHTLNGDETGTLSGKLNMASESLGKMISEVFNSAQQLSNSAEQLAETSARMSESSQTQAAAVEEASASLEEISGSIEMINNNAGEQAKTADVSYRAMEKLKADNETVTEYAGKALEAARNTTIQASTGQKLMQNTIEGMNSINESTQKIAETVSFISDLSDKVNLLALNASIEAARAGDHGKGFAVVAEEISKLADQTASSTKTITEFVHTGLKEVERGREFVDATGEALKSIIGYIAQTEDIVSRITGSAEGQAVSTREVLEHTKKVTEMSESISISTNEQMMTNQEMAKTVEQINQITQTTAAAAEEIAASAGDISSRAEILRKYMELFKV